MKTFSKNISNRARRILAADLNSPSALTIPGHPGLAGKRISQRRTGMVGATRRGGCIFAGALLALGFSLTARAEPAASTVADFSLEELINVKVTSVSKKEQNLFDAATAITVISNDELRRSGVTSIPDALRSVPGLNVGAVNSSQWAVTARGFNGLYAKDLLVLVDGRGVYTPNFSGVFWDLQQTMLEDVDRIEVIRGPGATIWGANAVNGVINVTTRSARDTQGGLVYGGGGDVQQAMVGGRYGGKLGEDTYYRVFGGYHLHDDYPLANGQPARDDWQSGQFGFRLDHYPEADTHLTWQADATALNFDADTSDGYNANTVLRWDRILSERSSMQVQAYYDHTYRSELRRAGMASDTFDVSLQHSFGLGEHNDVIWGAGGQYFQSSYKQLNAGILILNGRADSKLFNVFVQDELRLVPDRFTVTAGAKLEHTDYTGLEVEPSLRAVFKPSSKQTLWAAVSRAVRTPSVLDSQDVFATAIGGPFVGPGGGLYIPRALGNQNLNSEVLWAYEVGYRIQPSERASVDLTAFYNDYSGLMALSPIPSGFVPGTPGTAAFMLANSVHGKNTGAEVSVSVSPVDAWRLVGSYSLLLSDTTGFDPQDLAHSAPKHQASLRSSYDFNPRTSLDVQLRFVDKIAGVSAYVTADFRLAYRLTDHLEFSVVGQNLLERQHAEQGPAFFTVNAEVPRSFYGKITWKF